MLGKSARRTMNFFDTKSLYGWSESRATNAALRQMTGKRGAVISRWTIRNVNQSMVLKFSNLVK